MDFLVYICDLISYSKNIPLENIKDEEEAVSIAKNIALRTKEGCLVGLFTREGIAICGWKIIVGGELKEEYREVIQNSCFVGSESFEFAKKQVKKLNRRNGNTL